MTLSPDTRITIPEGVLLREVSGEAVILNLTTEHYFGLDEVGTDMWNALTQSETVGEAVKKLLEQYEVEQPRLEKDLADLVEQLVSHGLLEVHEQ